MDYDRDYSLKEIEVSNASILTLSSKSILPLAMLQYYSFVSLYAEEPAIIELKETKKSATEIYEIVFRSKIEVINGKNISRIIYTKDREINANSKFILRYIEWDKQAEIVNLKLLKKNTDFKHTDKLPLIKATTHLCNTSRIAKLKNKLFELENMYKAGVVLDRNTIERKYHELEVFAVYKWGSINYNFHGNLSNIGLEEHITSINYILDEILNENVHKVHSMNLDFLIDPILIKKIAYGSLVN